MNLLKMGVEEAMKEGDYTEIHGDGREIHEDNWSVGVVEGFHGDPRRRQ